MNKGFFRGILNRAVIVTALSILLVSCGEPDNKCRSRESMVLNCQAEELSGLHFPSQWQINQAKMQCERLYLVNKCY